MLYFANLNRCDALLHHGPQVVKTYRTTNLIVFLEDVLEIGSYPSFDIGCDLNEILTVDYPAQLLIQILIGAFDNSSLHSEELFFVKWHSLPGTVA